MNHNPQYPQPNPPASYYGQPVYAYPAPPPPPHDQFRRLLAILIRAFIISCAIIGLVVLILWLIYRPQKMKISVPAASLRSFNLSAADSGGNRFLSFDLSANISFRNPNKRVGIYYDWIEAQAFYDGERFGWAGLPGFYQGRKETASAPAEFHGRSAVAIGDRGAEEFQTDNAAGVFPVDLWVFGRVRYKFGSAVTRRYLLRARCDLRLPLAKGGFNPADCDVSDL
ncbi:Putative syntaxin-24 [Apostasia shenzhenica]|uniref:Syntaxin-24 n=1 Tax=Apostasia shenzhenica TaxID=1088818 RepID=A0A2I0AS01_9ASPA|nr:Putative syntaxin-24 [Apostasia shenzhenica]